MDAQNQNTSTLAQGAVDPAIVDRLETIAAVKEAMEEIRQGRHLPAREAMLQSARMHNLSTPSDDI